jgi:hypothetical protein
MLIKAENLIKAVAFKKFESLARYVNRPAQESCTVGQACRKYSGKVGGS